MKNLKIQIYCTIQLNNMIPSNKVICLIFTFIVFFMGKCISQDLRDFEHTQKFANYLFLSKQFALASEEYERLVYYDSTNNNSKYKLIQSYRQCGKFDVAIDKLNQFYKDSIAFVKKEFAEEYVKNLILTKQNEKVIEYIKINKSFDENTRQNYMLASLLLEKDWDKSFNYALNNAVTTDKKNADLHVIAFRSKQIKYKKPFVAAMFSTIIPGTGKIYTKNWKDGLIALMLVGVNAWQSYRGFHKYGSNSAYGWIFAGLTGSFYIGNIYGSYKSAKKYNNKLDEEMYNNAWHLIVDDF
jgi:tetratricopeptide (TPR) repeat protein